MSSFLIALILVPLFGLIISLLPGKTNERFIYAIVTTTLWLQLVQLAVFSVLYITQTNPSTFLSVFRYYHKGHSNLSFDVYFDGFSMIYGWVSVILSLFIVQFSRFYLHRDKGYKRFFNNILFFFTGLMVVLFSGNFETLIIGWEILGISSFFLIGYYRQRYLPVKNAIKVVSLYRLSDIVLLLAVWMCHLAFEKNINFVELANETTWAAELAEHSMYFYLIPFLFLLVAIIKSAQFPFSSWLPRAMEGPTTSTAIFYGALSVHIGLFLLLRVEPLWADKPGFRILLALLGLLTSLISTSIASVQSSVKTQIAYSSIAQIGLMFVEVALGLHILVMVHFAGNAFLRTYQLLVSPSVLNYLIHEQYYHFQPPKDKTWFGKDHWLRSTLFILSIKEFHLDKWHYSYLWRPFKIVGERMRFLSSVTGYGITAIIFLFSTGSLLLPLQAQTEEYRIIFSGLCAIYSLLLVLQSFTERFSVFRAWIYLVVAQFLIVFAAIFNGSINLGEALVYVSGVVIAGGIGHYCLHKLTTEEPIHDLAGHYGHIYEHPKLGLGFLFAGLALSGFPISPTFIGLDIIYSNMHDGEFFLPLVIGVTLIFVEIAAIRLYSRVYLGPHVKSYHPVAFRSS